MNKISNQHGLRLRSFEIIRKPELIGSSFSFNNVDVRYVGTNPENNISFYVNCGCGGVIGVRVHPDGRKVLENASVTTNENSRTVYNAKRKQRYLQFKNAFGSNKGLLASHAVYIAWRNKKIPAGMSIDHINGCSTNNFIGNLRCISLAINSRDGGFLTKLRNKGFNPSTIQRGFLLRYFGRMAILKASITNYRYCRLYKDDLGTLLYDTDQTATLRFYQKYNLKINFQSCPTTSKKCGA